MGWGGPGGLTGAAAKEEGDLLLFVLNAWIKHGVFRTGEAVWDGKEGTHTVDVTLSHNGETRCWTVDEFTAYTQGLQDALGHTGRSDER